MNDISELFQPWRLKAACRNTDDPDAWYAGHGNSEDKQRNRRAKQTCSVCPVQAQCQQFADSAHVPYGIWGGRRRNAVGEVSGHTNMKNRSSAS